MLEKALEMLEAKTIEKGGIKVVPFFYCREAARECGVSFREMEIFALENGICPSRYERSIGTLGMDGQRKLLESRVAVVGCGGLGGWIIEILARCGVGEILMIDGDVFDDNNLNRQLFAIEENIGAPKAEAAARRVRMVNGAVRPIPRVEYINEKNGASLLKGCSAVVDALDNNSGRRAVFGVCRELGIPFVHGAIGGFYGQLSVLRPDDRPLWESCDAPDKGIEVSVGNPPFIPPFIASLQAAETVKIIAGLDGQLHGALLWFDLLNHETQEIKL